MPEIIKINNNISVGGTNPLLLIAGPCQIESREHAFFMAKELTQITAKLPVNLIYKSSYDKANRTSITGVRGIGIEAGLNILQEIKNEFNIPVLTDIHSPEQAKAAAEVVDVLQIPAFLCRQTDLLLASGKTGKVINVKKGQFLAPEDMAHVAKKIASTGNNNILLCERGTSFGYRDLVVDMRGLQIMKECNYPVIFDATHSVQSLGGANGSSGGQKKFIPTLAKAAIAAGVDGVFIECHQEPQKAPSDGASMLPLNELSSLLKVLCELYKVRG